MQSVTLRNWPRVEVGATGSLLLFGSFLMLFLLSFTGKKKV